MGFKHLAAQTHIRCLETSHYRTQVIQDYILAGLRYKGIAIILDGGVLYSVVKHTFKNFFLLYTVTQLPEIVHNSNQ